MSSWRVAKSLLKLREQVDAKWPNRDTSSDGTIGDSAHQATKSDHNPNSAGVVTAMDITHDPAHGLDARKLAETLVASRDNRIKYIISNAQIVSSTVSPWQWRPYTGANAHRHHVHISVTGPYDDERPWNLGGEPMEKVEGRQYGITATRFKDSAVAYPDVRPGWNDRYGVALPYRFKGERPKVRVFSGWKSVVCEIIDIGPWYDGTPDRGPFDPYWETGKRPRAETDPRTNGAGIDVTFPLDEALGLGGKGLVDWEFVTTDKPAEKPTEKPQPKSIDEALARIDAAVADIRELAKVTQQPPTQLDWAKIIQPILAEMAPKIVPLLLPYLGQILPQLMPYLLDAMFRPRPQPLISKTGVQGGVVGGAIALISALATHYATKGSP